MFTASINSYNKGLTKKDFIEYLKRQDLITEEEIQEIDAMSLDSISSIYSEEFCQFSELNNQKMAESKEQTASIFPEQDMQSGGVNDITIDDATSAIKAEFLVFRSSLTGNKFFVPTDLSISTTIGSSTK